MWYFRSPEIVFGADALSHLDTLSGERAFIVTDPVVLNLGLAEKVQQRLKATGIETTMFAEVEPEPSLDTVRRGAKAMLAYRPDWVVGVGGGSAMDAAMAMWMLYERPDLSPDAINPFETLGLGQKAQLLCIPTTAGTGSEVTVGVMLTDPAEKRKLEIASLEALPALAIVDPEFTADLPRQITADTGIDVLTHTVEAYSSTWANDFTDGLALQATRMVFTYLPRAVEHGEADMEAREKMANAATLAGLAITNSHIALAHAMGHSAGAIFGIPHGRITGLFLPYTVEYTANGGVGRYLDLTHILGLPAADEREAGPVLARAIRELLACVGQPVDLQAAAVSRSQFQVNREAICDRAEMDASLITSRRVPSRAELEQLFQYAYDGRPVDF
jgi:alcohol dehydrogenase class IV